ncbi:hypothetical protein ACFY0A_29215 [Streptomyces sp. NPDC001698]|uniref:hypothetical protein n=1 Tax=Streptomyces sp. NPDC001698 TaxID=3364601 RepID=UPI0036789710
MRQFLLQGITVKAVPARVMSQLYEVAEDWELPPEACGVEATGYRMRPRHRVKVPCKKGEQARPATPDWILGHCRPGAELGHLNG